jgi:hypothetical protein
LTETFTGELLAAAVGDDELKDGCAGHLRADVFEQTNVSESLFGSSLFASVSGESVCRISRSA